MPQPCVKELSEIFLGTKLPNATTRKIGSYVQINYFHYIKHHYTTPQEQETLVLLRPIFFAYLDPIFPLQLGEYYLKENFARPYTIRL